MYDTASVPRIGSEARSSPRHLQRARSAKFPAQDRECFGLPISIDVRFYRVRRRSNAKRPLERAVRVKRLERMRNCGGAGGQSPQRPSLSLTARPYPAMWQATSSPIFFVPASFPAAFTAAISPAISPVRQPSSSTLSTALSIARASVSA